MLSPPDDVDDACALDFFKRLDYAAYTVLVNSAMCTAIEGASYFKWDGRYYTVWRSADERDLRPISEIPKNE